MGSAIAGAKAGTIASLYFAGSISLFNLLLLLAFKNQALSYLDQNFSTCSGATAESCYNAWIFLGVPFDDFTRIAVIALLFAIAIGVYFDYIPGTNYTRKTLIPTLIMLVAMLFLNLFGIVTSQLELVLMISFEVFAAILYAVVMARLYRRFTREVEFQTVPPSGKVVVDSRNLTGKKRTFSVNSSHKVEAAGELKTFKGWLVSGGVSVKEPKELKTSIVVSGDGLLKLA